MYSIVYYSDKVFEDIERWPVGIAANYERLTNLIRENGPNLGMPYTKALGDGLFEIRAKGAEGIGRAFFCSVIGQRVVILHSFIKKTQQTPKKEMKLARQRLQEVKSNV